MSKQLLKAIHQIHLGPTPEEVVKPGQLFEVEDGKQAKNLVDGGHAVEHETEEEVAVVKAATPKKPAAAPKGTAKSDGL